MIAPSASAGARLRALLATSGACGVALGAACGPAPLGPEHGAGGACVLTLSRPPLLADTPEALEPPLSRVVVDARATVRSLSQQLEKQVPVLLGSASRQDIGAAGEVSYTVTRGKVTIDLEGEHLRARVPVDTKVEICKSLGPVCIRYGSCNPQLLAVTRVPLVLAEDYAILPSRVSVALTRGCVIAGYDAGPEIRRQAARQIGTVEQRINASVPDVRPAVAAGWRQLHVPVALSRDSCIRVEPTRLAQSPPTLAEGQLGLRLAAFGRASLEGPCSDQSTPGPLPARALDASLPEHSELVVPIRTSRAALSGALTLSLSKPEGATRVLKVDARPVRHDGQSRLALDLTLSGRLCGETTVLASLRYDPKRARLVLHRLTALDPSPELTPVIQELERRADVPLPIDVGVVAGSLRALIQASTSEVADPVRVTVSVPPARIDRVEVDAEGSVALLLVTGTARVELP